MSRPRLLLIDEPSLGLSPKVRTEVFAAIAQIHRSGVSVLLVEQEVAKVFQLAARNYVLSHGRVIAQGTAAELTADEGLRTAYLGI
jgi:branched-chain amino acid transport system ATP-binding protein